MAPFTNVVRRFFGYTGSAALILLAAATAENNAARAHDAAMPPPAPAKTEAAAHKPRSVKENIKELGQEVTDPSTPARIKAHEQELEKKIEAIRERQRKDHGTAKPSDAVDLAKSVGSTNEGTGTVKATEKPKGDRKAKADGKAKPDSKPKLEDKAQGEGKPPAPPLGAAKTTPTP